MIIMTSNEMVVVSDAAVRDVERREPHMLDFRLLYDVGRMPADDYASMLIRALDDRGLRHT